jgi:uncharacterized protein (TIGR03067 family)
MRRDVRTYLAIGLFLAPACLSAAGPADDKEKLQGTWKVVSVELGGKGNEELKLDRLMFDGDKVRVVGTGRGQEEEGTFKLDPAKSPKTIDIQTLGSKQQPVLGIYQLEDHNLKLCLGRPGDERPANFEPKDNPRQLKAVLKRAKP